MVDVVVRGRWWYVLCGDSGSESGIYGVGGSCHA